MIGGGLAVLISFLIDLIGGSLISSFGLFFAGVIFLLSLIFFDVIFFGAFLFC